MVVPYNTRTQRGLTLLEALIVLSIVMLLGFGATGVAQWVQRARTTTLINTVITDLSLARSEAIKRGLPVVLCASRTGESCATGIAWSEGYIVFVDENANEKREATELVVRVHARVENLRLEYRGFGSHAYIVYQPSGIAAYNGTFTVCPPAAGVGTRGVIISPSGRARIAARTATQAADVCG